jgi:2-phosphoglycerate kinase
MQDDIRALQRELARVYWIGGSPCSGKSSIASTLAEMYGFTLYRTDDAYVRHEKMVTPQCQPIFYKLTHYTSEELWMRPVEQQVVEEIALYREEFPLILEEILALPKSAPVLVEGAALLPECVVPLLSDVRKAIWLLPTAEFQQYHYERRAWAREVVRACTQPGQAFQNWMQRDIQFARFIHKDAQDCGMCVLEVDGTHSLAENTIFVEQYFQFDQLHH